MAGITERNKQNRELIHAGYTARLIKDGKTKVTLYRHEPSRDTSGKIAEDIGSSLKGLPGTSDYLLSKSRIGQFPWMPSESCMCQWCVESRTLNVESSNPNAMAKASCKECDYVAEHVRLTNATASLRKHERDKHLESVPSV